MLIPGHLRLLLIGWCNTKLNSMQLTLLSQINEPVIRTETDVSGMVIFNIRSYWSDNKNAQLLLKVYDGTQLALATLHVSKLQITMQHVNNIRK